MVSGYNTVYKLFEYTVIVSSTVLGYSDNIQNNNRHRNSNCSYHMLLDGIHHTLSVVFFLSQEPAPLHEYKATGMPIHRMNDFCNIFSNIRNQSFKNIVVME
jgi:hypothetical protein